MSKNLIYCLAKIVLPAIASVFLVLSVAAESKSPAASKSPSETKPEAVLKPLIDPLSKKPVQAQVSLSTKEVEALLAKNIPNAKIREIVAMPQFGGLYWVTMEDYTNIFVTPDGKEFILGQHFGFDNKGNLINLSQGKQRAEQFKNVAAIPFEEMIVFPATNAKGEAVKSDKWILVFTDIDCGYCRKLHTEIEGINSAGIEVRYAFFPRTGIDSNSYQKAVSVWCAEDQQASMTSAKAGLPLAVKNCDNPVKSQFETGVNTGVSGTPTIWTYNGKRIGGYVPLARMLQIMQS